MMLESNIMRLFKYIYIQIIVLTVLIGSDISAEQCKNDFLFMEAIPDYVKHSDVSQTNIISVPMLYADRYVKSEGDSYVPGPDVFESKAKNLESNYPNSPVFIVDLEHWHVGFNTTEEQALNNIERFVSTMENVRSVVPDQQKYQFGYYMFGPIREYWKALKGIEDIEYKRWMQINDRIKPMMDNVDALFPSLYTFYNDKNAWTKYAKANISEARRISQGKPVYCVLWPRFHGSNKTLGKQWIPADFWKEQIELTYAYCDGIVVWDYGSWSGYKVESPDGLTWWEIYKAFAQENNISG